MELSLAYLMEQLNCPNAQLDVWKELSTNSYSLQVKYNATTFVKVTEINYMDLAEYDFFAEEIVPAIQWLRTGGQYISTTYKAAKATTKHLNETKQALKEI